MLFAGEMFSPMSLDMRLRFAMCQLFFVLQHVSCGSTSRRSVSLSNERLTNENAARHRYRSKALSMFQRVDGVEVCLFSMYVQEYGADAPYFNARRAYISYLDSGTSHQDAFARNEK